MSIKTSKRIALGVITALVFAPFAAIAPASAAVTGITGVTNTSAASLDAASFGTVTYTTTTAFLTSVQLPASAVGRAIYTAQDGFVGTIATVVTGGTFGGTFAAATTTTARTGVDAFLGTLPTTTTAQGITAGIINGMTVTAGSLVGLNVRIAGTPTAGEEVRANFVGVGVAGESLPLQAAATQINGFIQFTAPVTAGSYSMTIQHSVAGTFLTAHPTTDRPFADVVFTLTVAAANALVVNQFPNSANTTASTAGTLAGVKVSSVGIETVQVSGRTGVQVGFAPQYRLTRNAGVANDAGVTNADLFARIAYSVTNPAGTAVTVVSAQGGATASTSQTIAGSGTAIPMGATGATVAVTQAISPTTGFPQKGAQVFFSAATAGTYTITAFHDANLDGLVSVGEATTTSTVVIAADALPTITMTTYGQSVSGAATDALNGGIGHLVKISLKNGDLPASLGLSEVLTITGPAGTVIDQRSARDAATFKLVMGDAGEVATIGLTQANFDAAGNAYINVGNSTAIAANTTYTLTAVISGGTGAGATGSGTFTVLSATLFAPTVNPDRATTFRNLTGVAGTGRLADAAAANYDFTVERNKATNVVISYVVGAGAESDSYEATLTDTYGLITGLIGGQYKLKQTFGTTATTATSRVSFTVPVPALAATVTGNAVTLTISQTDTIPGGAVDSVFRIAQALAAATTSFTNPALDAASFEFRAGVGTAHVLTAKVVSQFGLAIPFVAVTAAITGRNSTVVVPTMLTDANGLVTFTLTDASTSVVLLSDVVTFSPATGATSSVTINYATYLPAATITMTTPDSASATASGVAGTVTSDIDAGLDGPQATTATVTAVLKDANGGTLPAGIPVTFTVTGDGAAILSTTKIGYTNGAGSVETSVYAWKQVNAVVTATVGSITASGTVYFVQDTAAEARNVTAALDATGRRIVGKATDRFGNPVSGVDLKATVVTGDAFFGTGTSVATGTSNEAGEVTFVLAREFSQNSSVVVAFSTATAGQSTSAKGYIGAAIAANAFEAFVAGTVGKAEIGVGAEFDAAGNNATPAINVPAPAVVVPPVVYDNPTLSFVKSAGRVILSGTAVDGEGDIIIYVKRVGTTAWKERAKTLEVAAPGDFNGSIRAPKNNVLIRVKQEGTGQFSNQIIVLK